MGRYDVYEQDQGYGVEHFSRASNSLIIDDREYAPRRSANRAPRGRSASYSPSRGRSADPAGRLSARDRRGRSLTRYDDKSTSSKKSMTSTASKSQLHLRSKSREELRQYQRSLSRGRGGGSVTSSSKKRRRQRKSNWVNGLMNRGKAISADVRSLASRTKKKVYSPKNNHGDDSVSTIDGSVSIDGVTVQPIGHCLVADVKCITSWNWRFTLSQVLSALSVVLMQVPECISYAYIAGIDPFHALQATWMMNVISSLVGGRPGLVCGSSGLGAIALKYVVSNYGVGYIFYAVILSGICQVLFGATRMGNYLRLLPPGITIGILNALVILVTLLQLRYFKVMPAGMVMEEEDSSTSSTDDNVITIPYMMETTTSSGVSEESLNQPWAYYVGFDLPWTTSISQAVVVIVEAIVAMLICWILPRFTTIIPSSLVALVLITVANIVTQEPNPQWVMPTVGDYCLTELPTSRVWFPIFTSSYSLPALSEWETIRAVFPAGILLFCINLLETMVCLNVADNYTNHDSEQDRVFYGQGVANMVCGLMGGMSGAGMAHTTLFGLREGGMTSISTFIAGVMMLFVITFAYPAISFVPLGAVMGVTLHLLLNMIQWTPMIAFILKYIPSSCLMDKPSLLKRRLATPDVFSTMGTSIFTLCASTYGLAGYFVGVICYACDPIAHAIIISGENEHNYRFVELSLPKASNQRIKSKDEQSSEDDDEDSDVSGREYIKQESKAIEVIEHHIERSLYDEKV